MRLVVDLQVCQGAGRHGDAAHDARELVMGLVRSQGQHEIIVVLNAHFVETVEPLRAWLDSTPSCRVAVWSAPASGLAAELLREAYIASLEPDWVLLPSLLDDDVRDAVASIGRFYAQPTAVLLRDSGSESFLPGLVSQRWQQRRLDDLRRADLVLAQSPAAASMAIDFLGFEDERVFTLAGQDELDAGGDWDLVALRVWAGLERFHQPRMRQQVRGERLRLAYVLPQPPSQELPGQDMDLIRELTRWYEVDVIVKAPQVLNGDDIRVHGGLRSIGEFRHSAAGYHRVLYSVADTEGCAPILDLLREFPGAIVLRDFFLAGVQERDEAIRRRPHAWTRALALAHGYPAVAERHRPGMMGAVAAYPANLPVLQDALGVIVQDHRSLALADHWYGTWTSRDWELIAPVRWQERSVGRSTARAALGLDPDALVVSAFAGAGDDGELALRLLAAWQVSPLSRQEGACLVFVGAQTDECAGRLRRAVLQASCRAHVMMTGRITSGEHRNWLVATDIAVQLQSYGSAKGNEAILDCLSAGVATVVNAVDGLIALDDQVTLQLPADVSQEQLAGALVDLSIGGARRRILVEAAWRFIQNRHHPRRGAQRYAEALERFYARTHHKVPHHLAALDLEGDLAAVAVAYNRNHPPAPRPRQLLFDVSEMVQRDARTGIQRVVRAILSEWLRSPPEGYVVEPVYATTDRQGFRYARRYTTGYLGIPGDWADDESVEAWEGDVFVAVDLQPVLLPAQALTLRDWRNRGVRTAAVVYDLLPLLLADHFPPSTYGTFLDWLKTVVQLDVLVGGSKAVADDILDWLQTMNPVRSRPLSVGWYHNGADIDQSEPSGGLPNDADAVLGQLHSRPSFLMVGTIEPRKGHAQVLAGFEQLWRDGTDANLVIVGKEGWMVHELMAALRGHPQLRQRLFLLEGASDEYLEAIYGACACLIAASEGEGFGLPLIEAAHHHLAILARDIPVFREVAGGHASYFPDETDATVLALALRDWLESYNAGQHTRSEGLRYLTWREGARQLWDAIHNGGHEGGRNVHWSTRSQDDYVFWGSDRRLNTTCGTRRQRDISTTGNRGFLFFGPYQKLRMGTYRLTVTGWIGQMTGDEYLDVCGAAGTRTLFRQDLVAEASAGTLELGGLVVVDEEVDDFEIRFFVTEDTRCSVAAIRVERLPDVTRVEAAVSGRTNSLQLMAPACDK
ncbi:glycosyltransferase involved in cell wall biosynthesis [Nitrospirillum amazonense]|uniref:Glycosyltransferase involved in cell wall biosynthesis n=2 Tax=Nitrospirillum amazonense TaxID=28077 RepID=A0A560FSG0_9PROT|nr:glycosyltransferase involved in cell wall biosynthesis [Nitrospirillum amazonense]